VPGAGRKRRRKSDLPGSTSASPHTPMDLYSHLDIEKKIDISVEQD